MARRKHAEADEGADFVVGTTEQDVAQQPAKPEPAAVVAHKSEPQKLSFDPRADHHAPPTTANDIKGVYASVRRAASERIIADLCRTNRHVAALKAELDALKQELAALKAAK